MSDSDSDSSRSDASEESTSGGCFGRQISKTTIFLGLLVVVSIALQAFTALNFTDAMGETAGMLALGACLVNIIIAPIAVIISFKKDKFSDFSDLIDQMKEEAARLGEENKELSGTIDEMEDSVAELNDIEGALSSLSGSQESNVQDIVRLVKEAKEIAVQQKIILKGNALQQMVEIVLEAFQSSESEVYLDDLGLEHLMMGLANVKELKFEEEATKRLILSSSRNLKDCMAIVNHLAETSGIGEDL